jgi:hypothetical protein
MKYKLPSGAGNKQIFNFGLIFFFIPIINYDLLLLVATMVFGGPLLILDKEFSPPEDIPDYKDRIYSVAVGHIIREPIIAKLVDDDNNTITNTTGLTFSIESVYYDESDDGGSNNDTFATEGANLCQYANRREYPNRYDGTFYK